MKKLFCLILCLALLLLAACADPVIGGERAETPLSADPDAAPEALIELRGDTAHVPGRGVSVKGSVVTIGAPGEYTVRGTLSDGRIVVDLKENPGKVTLFLDGVDLTCLMDSAIYVAQAKELNLVLAAGSENRVVSGTEADLASFDGTRQGAAIFAEDDLDVQGEGALTVLGYLNNGITCKDDIKLKGGSLTVRAANNGVRASESVTMSGGTLTVECGNDGVKASSAKKTGKGFVSIEGGSLTVLAHGDGVSAETELRISGGELRVETAGSPAEASCKGLKGKTGVLISGGTIEVRAEDHAVKSGAALSIVDGELSLVSKQGKGLCAETELSVSGGSLSVDAADDGLSSADTVRISGGELLILSGADGIQGGKRGTGFAAEVGTVSIEGGRTRISAFRRPVDAKAVFRLSGGSLLACGSSAPAPESQIPFLLYSLQGGAGDELTLTPELTLRAGYVFSSVFAADESFREGDSYTLRAGSGTLEARAGR